MVEYANRDKAAPLDKGALGSGGLADGGGGGAVTGSGDAAMARQAGVTHLPRVY
jgi:hypothetical protein